MSEKIKKSFSKNACFLKKITNFVYEFKANAKQTRINAYEFLWNSYEIFDIFLKKWPFFNKKIFLKKDNMKKIFKIFLKRGIYKNEEFMLIASFS